MRWLPQGRSPSLTRTHSFTLFLFFFLFFHSSLLVFILFMYLSTVAAVMCPFWAVDRDVAFPSVVIGRLALSLKNFNKKCESFTPEVHNKHSSSFQLILTVIIQPRLMCFFCHTSLGLGYHFNDFCFVCRDLCSCYVIKTVSDHMTQWILSYWFTAHLLLNRMLSVIKIVKWSD